MDQLIEIGAFIVCGGLGVVLLRFLKPKDIAKQNSEVIVKIEEKQKEVEQIKQQIETNKAEAQTKIDEIEVEKNKDLSVDELADFFEKRK